MVFFFNLMDHSKASGNANRINMSKSIHIDHTRLLAPSTIIKALALQSASKDQKTTVQRRVNSLKLIPLLNQPYYLLNHKRGLYAHFYNEHSLIDAYTGEPKIIDEVMAQALAQSTYSGNGQVVSVVKLHAPMEDMLKEENTAWQVNFTDEVSTSVYIDASSGRLIGHSNEDKRFADFFFKLHFMDYGVLGKIGSFNNGLIIFFSLITSLLCLTGVVWVIELLSKGRYKW